MQRLNLLLRVDRVCNNIVCVLMTRRSVIHANMQLICILLCVGMHGAIHCAIGGNMCSAQSAGSPEFWIHHGFVDKIWHDWQQQPGNTFAYKGDLDAPMIATPVLATPRQVMDNGNLIFQVGYDSVSVDYVQPQSYSWLNQVLKPLDNATLVTIARTPAVSSAGFLEIMHAPQDVINNAQLQAAERNGLTSSSPYNLMRTD